MAQTDRFYFWRAFYDALMMLDNDAQRGEFVRGMCQWAFDGVSPTFSDKMLQFGFLNIRDQLSESVNIGRVARETGSQGGRPRKTVPKTVPKTTPKTVPETVPETEGKGTDRKGSDLPPSGEGVAPDADASALRPGETELERIERVYGPQPKVPPKPEGS